MSDPIALYFAGEEKGGALCLALGIVAVHRALIYTTWLRG